MTFKPGEIVRRNNGWTPMFIVAMSPSGRHIRARYCGSSDEYDATYRPDRIKLVVNEDDLSRDKLERLTPSQRAQLRRQLHPDYHNENPSEGDTEMSKTIYQTNETPTRFCTLLARNSEGNMVLEVRGTGEVIVRSKSEVTEVRPYTVQLKNTNRGSMDHAIAVKGSVAAGDMILRPDGYIWQVRQLDSGSSTTNILSGQKILTAALEEAVPHDLIDDDFIPDDEDDDSL